jgi:amidase
VDYHGIEATQLFRKFNRVTAMNHTHDGIAGNPDTPDLVYTPARELASQIRAGARSAREVMSAFLDRIDACNPDVNAICTLIPREAALALADTADRERARGESLGPLHGLPVAVKDLSATRGIRTTMGSPIFATHVPDADSLLVTRLKAAGALVIGKTNTPEFGTGSHTFNPLFGATRNPWNLERTAGGSSGGAAAALAAGMLPIADGSDMGGSLRNPAAFCSVVGLRPSLGRVPHFPCPMAWQSRLGVEGPMARDVRDCALLLSALAGADERDPMSIHQDPASFRGDLEYDFGAATVGWTPDLGLLPIDPEVVAVCERSLPLWEQCGFRVEPACPDLSGAMVAFKVLRATYYAHFGATLLAEHRHQMKDTVIENIEEGLTLSALDVARADAVRTRGYLALLDFFKTHDFLVLPTTQVMPFDLTTEWVREINGSELTSYLDWMASCCIISLYGLPAISIPCGFSAHGLPVGLQIVGKPRGDLDLLRAAFALEQTMPSFPAHPTL